MKISEIIFESQVASNKIVGAILKNSGLSDSPSREVYVDKINKLYSRFRQIQGQLNPNLPQVKTFLFQFDGNHGSPKFEGDIKDITRYSIEQLQFLIDEYTTDNVGQEETEDAALLKQTQYDDKNAEISKSLWFNEDTAIINLPGFRVYQPKSEADAVKFGWYQEKLQRELRPGWHSWCVTWRGDKNNRWGYYRSQGGTFYFIIDESKLQSENPDQKKYYLGALQIIKGKSYSHKGYELTDINNPGEIEYSWDQILKIYPQLADFKDKIQPLEFNEDELKTKSVISRINENPSSEYFFGRVGRKYKLQYINNYFKLSNPVCWYSMDETLRKKYITLTQSNDFLIRFPNFEFLRAVKKTNLGNLLDSEIKNKDKSDGIKSLSEKMMGDLAPMEERVGIKNPNIILYKTRKGKYGLWNNATSDWLDKFGNVYEPSYSKVDESIIENPKTKDRFYVDKFGTTDGDYFVAITHVHDIDSYFLSKNAWEKIKDKVESEPIEKDIDQSQDIYETKKGV